MIAESTITFGSATPRIAPPLPLLHDLAGYRRTAETLGIEPMPWQEIAAMYATATGPEGRYLYREFAAIVARQNGKTTFSKPLVISRLLAGRRIMHIAQVRELPRIMFEAIADAIEEMNPDLLPRRRGKVIYPRRGAGSESIVLTNGGQYRIAAAIMGGRGFSFDDLLIDELREMTRFDVINAAKPAQRFSENPQTIYLSNMGTDDSVILNSLTLRAGLDPSLAYLEWSADPDYATGDVRGWYQANPSIGHYPQVLRDLEQDYTAALLAGNLAGFEMESLCRKVPTARELAVSAADWAACHVPRPLDGLEGPYALAVDIHPGWERASIAVAGVRDDGRVAVELYRDLRDGLTAERIIAEVKAFPDPVVSVVYEGISGGLASFRRDAEMSGIPWVELKPHDVMRACMDVTEMIQSAKLAVDDPLLDAQIAWTARRPVGPDGGFRFSRSESAGPIDAVMAMTFAANAIQATQRTGFHL
jgi:hypothetical protein